MKRIGLGFAAALALVACTGGDDDDDAFSGDTEVTGETFSATTAGDVTLAGATVEALPGGPSTTSDANGDWTLMLQSNLTATIRASATDHWGSQVTTEITPGTSFDFGLPQDNLVAAVGAALGLGAPDETTGLLAVGFIPFAGSNTAGGFAVTLSAANDGSFTFDSAGNPVLSTKTLPYGDQTLIFVNVAPGTTTLTVTSAGGFSSCVDGLGVANVPVAEKVLSQTVFFCQ